MARIVSYYGRVVVVVGLISLLQTQGAAARDAEKRANIEALLKDTGMIANRSRLIDVLVPQIMGSLKKENQKKFLTPSGMSLPVYARRK